MARLIGKLTVIQINKEKKKGLHSDGGGLYLQVTSNGAKSWIMRFKLDGKSHDMGLGAYPTVTLSDARDKAADCRKLLSVKINPINARNNDIAKAKAAASNLKTFKECAEAYILAHESVWNNEKHIKQWRNSLATHAYPELGNVPVREIDIALILKVLKPIWHNTTETASRVRGRIERVLNWAIVQGLRDADNPAVWKGKLENLLPTPSKISSVNHHPALKHREISSFLKTVRANGAASADALELTILTAVRTGESLGAEWDEFDLINETWVIPANRTKTNKELRVPLSTSALKLIKRLNKTRSSKYLFPSYKDKPLSVPRQHK